MRPHLEYAQTIWSPYKKKDIQQIENVQKHATKLITKIKHLLYEGRLHHLGLPILVYRRMRGERDLIETYKF